VNRLVLFDIDGTLPSTQGHSVRAVKAAYAAVYGRDPSAIEYRMDGKTGLRIAFESLGLAGLTRQEIEAGLPRFWARYEEELRRTVTPERTRVFPGVAALVTQVARLPQALLGLLTGNCEPAARIKLQAARLEGFALGAYGAHHEDRAALPAVAVEHAERLSGRRFQGKEIVIIGDTPNEIRCGRALGVKSIAVATGRYSAEQLAGHGPDHVFPDFSDVTAVLRAVQA
jgi:phosphoglycolate phosphatase-like HAD superfamily hydrolase